MKNSNSRGSTSNNIDKNIHTMGAPTSNKLMKTDTQQPKRQEMEKTNYNRPASGKKLQSNKILPPKPIQSKKQYVVEDHMTQSRIYEAKQGLQLLKKKMSSKGLSRQKLSSNQQIPLQKPITSLKTVQSNKQQAQYYENRNTNMPPKRNEKVNQREPNIRKPPTSTTTAGSIKNLNDTKTPQNQRKQPPPPAYQQYSNEQMEIPIKPKKDFNAMLEEQLRKQKMAQKNPSGNYGAKSKPMQSGPTQYPDQNMALIQCRHCQRKFGQNAIEKHQKICMKVFQSKRKAFDSAAQRGPQVEGEFDKMPPSKKNQPSKAATLKKQPPPPKKQEEAVPKWKAASLAFRANLKQAKGVALTKQQKQANQIAQGLVQCQYCGRKFNDKAATRHIPFCQTKSKQIPRGSANTKKR